MEMLDLALITHRTVVVSNPNQRMHADDIIKENVNTDQNAILNINVPTAGRQAILF